MAKVGFAVPILPGKEDLATNRTIEEIRRRMTEYRGCLRRDPRPGRAGHRARDAGAADAHGDRGRRVRAEWAAACSFRSTWSSACCSGRWPAGPSTRPRAGCPAGRAGPGGCWRTGLLAGQAAQPGTRGVDGGGLPRVYRRQGTSRTHTRTGCAHRNGYSHAATDDQPKALAS